MRGRISGSAILAFGLLTFCYAAETEDAAERAYRLTQTALQFGVEGESVYREHTLRSALRLDPEQQLANWHSGRLRSNDGWITIADADHLFSGLDAADALATAVLGWLERT